MTIKKVTYDQLVQSPTVFVQVNTVKGYTCLDKSGEIINLFYKDKTPPTAHLDQAGIIIVNPVSGITQLEINHQVIVATLETKDNLKEILKSFSEKVSLISKTANVENVSRIGLRAQFAHYFEEENNYKEYFNNLISVDDFVSASVTLKVKVNDKLTAKIKITPVVRNQDFKKGFIFDIDISLDEEQVIKNIQDILEQIESNLKSTVEKYV